MTSELINALLKAQKEITPPVNDAKNPFFKSKYATLKNVIDTVREPLNKNGIYFQQKAHLIDGLVGVETVFYGHGGELPTGIVPVSPAKQEPQAYGSALSYAKRYSLCMACGIASVDEDDDGEKAMESFRETQVDEPEEYKHKGRFAFTNKKGKVISTCDDAVTYLNFCDKWLGGSGQEDNDVLKEKYFDLFKVNEETISQVILVATGVTKKRLNNLKEFYNEKV